MKRIILTLCILVAMVMTGDAGSFFKCKDRDGNILFTDSPPPGAVCEGMAGFSPSSDVPATRGDVPAPKTVDREPKTSEKSTPSVPSRDVPAPKAVDRVPKASERPAPVVEIYVTSWCPWSTKAKDYFTSRGISFSAYDIEKDPDAKRRKDEIDSRKGVPTVVINGTVVHGYNPEGYRRVLEGRR